MAQEDDRKFRGITMNPLILIAALLLLWLDLPDMSGRA